MAIENSVSNDFYLRSLIVLKFSIANLASRKSSEFVV